ncbi:MAG: hypothetical protein HOI66_21465 [Verrucomicrobia bacterium]|nr:hypothetical protein [Verrucomicrobiota bacterium]
MGVISLLAACQSTEKTPSNSEAFPPRGHAHNDYEHENPLLDALSSGFSSVEADIHLVNGALLVAHDADQVQTERTLKGLYLEPLRQRFLRNNGHILSDDQPFILLVDIKTDAESTYRVLENVLEKYKGMLTSFHDSFTLPGSVTVILSGNRPKQIVANQARRLVGIDGRLPDLENVDETSALVPLISDNWRSHFSWRGDGPISALELAKLESIVTRAHSQGRMIRFWANPDLPAYWSLAKNVRIDLINTDNLEGLSDFLSSPQTNQDQ